MRLVAILAYPVMHSLPGFLYKHTNFTISMSLMT